MTRAARFRSAHRDALGALAVLAFVSACGGARPTQPTIALASAPPSSAPSAATTDAQLCRDAPLLTAGSTARGTTTGRPDLFHASCGYGAASGDIAYRIHVEHAAHVALRLAAGYDGVLSLRSNCLDGDTELACNDDTGDERHSAIDADLGPGDYYVVVDGYEHGHSGFYAVSMSPLMPSRGNTATPIVRAADGAGATVTRTTPGAGVSGTVTFAKRHYTPHGLTQATTDAPAAHFVVEAIRADGSTLATTETDEQGAFRLAIDAGVDVRVRAVTRTSLLGNDIRVVSDPGTERAYEVSTAPFRVQGGEQIALHAWVGGVEPAGAFNILAEFVRYLSHVQQGFGHPLPPLYAFWRRGNNQALPEGDITAFLMDYHRHAGTYALQIQGGVAGTEDASDSDQFDDPVILHEFSHFVVHTMAGNFSIGGVHHNGELHFPSQALDEGAASALGCAVAGDSRYWDTAGLEPSGEILVDEDSESMTLPDRGIGSQNTAQTLIWDLADGAEGLADRDNDGVAIGLTGLMRIYASFHDDPIAFPGIHTVLERAVQLGLVTQQAASRLVRVPVEQGFAFPLAPADQWPTDMALPSEAQGRVDGRSQPAPSGGRNVSTNGLDAIRTFRIRVLRRGMVYIDLSIDGNGQSQPNHTHLDLQLFTRNLVAVVAMDAETATKGIHRILEPGTYIVLVRDGNRTDAAGTGNVGNFTLRVRQSSDFH